MRSQLRQAPAVISDAPEHCFIPSLPTLDPRQLLPTLEPLRPPRFPLDQLALPEAGAHLFYLARAGVHHAIRQFLDGKPGTVLMPAYHHGVEVEAVRAAGADIEFYRVDAQMRIDLEDIERRLVAGRPRVLYLTHFVGFAQPVGDAAALAARHGAILFEDCALALGSADVEGRPLGSHGEAAVFCLYKTLPVPHGGLLVAPGVAPPSTIAPPLTSTLHHAAGLTLAHLELHAPAVGRAVRDAARRASRRTVDALVDTVQTGTMHLLPMELGLGASRLVERLIARADLEMVVVRRRRNYRRLVEALDGCLPVLNTALPPGCCPLFVPVLVENKRSLRARLQARGLDAVDFWSSGDPACESDRFPEVTALRRHVLELPCHQSLDDEAIERVARAVKDELPHA